MKKSWWEASRCRLTAHFFGIYITGRCIAVLTEQVFVQARQSPKSIMDIYGLGL